MFASPEHDMDFPPLPVAPEQYRIQGGRGTKLMERRFM